jgi:hypothetical protein
MLRACCRVTDAALPMLIHWKLIDFLWTERHGEVI